MPPLPKLSRTVVFFHQFPLPFFLYFVLMARIFIRNEGWYGWSVNLVKSFFGYGPQPPAAPEASYPQTGKFKTGSGADHVDNI